MVVSFQAVCCSVSVDRADSVTWIGFGSRHSLTMGTRLTCKYAEPGGLFLVPREHPGNISRSDRQRARHISGVWHPSRPARAQPAISKAQRRLGHESIKTTVDTDGHLMSDSDDEILAAFGVRELVDQGAPMLGAGEPDIKPHRVRRPVITTHQLIRKASDPNVRRVHEEQIMRGGSDSQVLGPFLHAHRQVWDRRPKVLPLV